jgi:hypothetical protein
LPGWLGMSPVVPNYQGSPEADALPLDPNL